MKSKCRLQNCDNFGGLNVLHTRCRIYCIVVPITRGLNWRFALQEIYFCQGLSIGLAVGWFRGDQGDMGPNGPGLTGYGYVNTHHRIPWGAITWICHDVNSGLASVNTLRPRKNGRHFADDLFKCIFVNENAWISLKISMKFVPKFQINNIPALVQIMAWRRPGDKPLFETMMVSLLTHICVTRPQWVKAMINIYIS